MQHFHSIIFQDLKQLNWLEFGIIYHMVQIVVHKIELHQESFLHHCILRVLWTAKMSDQSIPKEMNPEYSLEGLMLKLKLQYFGYLM